MEGTFYGCAERAQQEREIAARPAPRGIVAVEMGDGFSV